MPTQNYAEESRKIWYCTDRDTPTHEQLQLGCLQRIATATEKMCRDRDALERELRGAMKTAVYWKKRAEAAERSNSALRGVVTKLKKRIKWLKSPKPEREGP